MITQFPLAPFYIWTVVLFALSLVAMVMEREYQERYYDESDRQWLAKTSADSHIRGRRIYLAVIWTCIYGLSLHWWMKPLVAAGKDHWLVGEITIVLLMLIEGIGRRVVDNIAMDRYDAVFKEKLEKLLVPLAMRSMLIWNIRLSSQFCFALTTALISYALSNFVLPALLR